MDTSAPGDLKQAQKIAYIKKFSCYTAISISAPLSHRVAAVRIK